MCRKEGFHARLGSKVHLLFYGLVSTELQAQKQLRPGRQLKYKYAANIRELSKITTIPPVSTIKAAIVMWAKPQVVLHLWLLLKGELASS